MQNWVLVGELAEAAAGPIGRDKAMSHLRDAASPQSAAIGAGNDDVLCLCYSSGTTGRPKGAMLTHEGQMWAIVSNLGSSEDFNLSGNYLLVMPMFHLGGLLPLEVAIFGGSTVVIMKAFDPNGVWDVVGRERVTSGLVVPAMLNAMLSVYDPAKHDLSSVRNLWCAAAPLPVTLIEQCMEKGIGLLQTYGLTECGGPGTILGESDATRKGRLIGQGLHVYRREARASRRHDLRAGRSGGVADPGQARDEGLLEQSRGDGSGDRRRVAPHRRRGRDG